MPFTKRGCAPLGRIPKGSSIENSKFVNHVLLGVPSKKKKGLSDEEEEGAETVEFTKRQRKLLKSSAELAASTESPGRNAAVSSTTIRRAARLAIAVLFQQLGGPPQPEWGGKDGTIVIIRRNLRDLYNPSRQKVVRVLLCVTECAKRFLEYTGQRMMTLLLNPKECHPNQLITAADEVRVLADCMENNEGLRNTTASVNALRARKAERDNRVCVHVGVSCVYGTFLRMDALVQRPERVKQGSNVSSHQRSTTVLS